MTPGVLCKHFDGKPVTATRTPDGWESGDADFAASLEALAAAPSTECGTPWVQSFFAATRLLGAEILQRPEPDPWPGA